MNWLLPLQFLIFQEKCLYSEILLLQRKRERFFIYTGIDTEPVSIVERGIFSVCMFTNVIFNNDIFNVH